jgi:hypothetical protein
VDERESHFLEATRTRMIRGRRLEKRANDGKVVNYASRIRLTEIMDFHILSYHDTENTICLQ